MADGVGLLVTGRRAQLGLFSAQLSPSEGGHHSAFTGPGSGQDCRDCWLAFEKPSIVGICRKCLCLCKGYCVCGSGVMGVTRGTNSCIPVWPHPTGESTFLAGVRRLALVLEAYVCPRVRQGQ